MTFIKFKRLLLRLLQLTNLWYFILIKVGVLSLQGVFLGGPDQLTFLALKGVV